MGGLLSLFYPAPATKEVEVREGYAWVGVAAQSVGVNGDPNHW